jgi:hypothetical protein
MRVRMAAIRRWRAAPSSAACCVVRVWWRSGGMRDTESAERVRSSSHRALRLPKHEEASPRVEGMPHRTCRVSPRRGRKSLAGSATEDSTVSHSIRLALTHHQSWELAPMS